MQDNSETITVCGLHRDTVELLDDIREALSQNTAEVAKVSNSLGWIKWVIGGFLGVVVTVILIVIPLVAGLNTRLTILERNNRAAYETTERGHTAGINIPTK